MQQAGAGLRADRDQQCGKGQGQREQRDELAGLEQGAEPREPPDQRDHRNRDGRQGGPFIDAGVIRHEQPQRAIAATAAQRLDPAGDHDCPHRQHDGQCRGLDPQTGAQGQRQEDRKDQRLPHPGPLFDRRFGVVRSQRGQPAIDQQGHDQALTQGKAAVALVVQQGPAGKGQHEGDQRDRQRGQQPPGNPLGGEDVDVEIGQHPQERLAQAQAQQHEDKAGERQIKHGGAVLAGWGPVLGWSARVRRAGPQPDRSAPRGPDRRAGASATPPGAAGHGSAPGRSSRSLRKCPSTGELTPR